MDETQLASERSRRPQPEPITLAGANVRALQLAPHALHPTPLSPPQSPHPPPKNHFGHKIAPHIKLHEARCHPKGHSDCSHGIALLEGMVKGFEFKVPSKESNKVSFSSRQSICRCAGALQPCHHYHPPFTTQDNLVLRLWVTKLARRHKSGLASRPAVQAVCRAKSCVWRVREKK